MTPDSGACQAETAVSESSGDGGSDDRSRLDRDFRQSLMALAMRRDPNIAEDLVHDTFVRALGSPAPWPKKLRAWLYRILENRFIDLVRRRRPTESIDDYRDGLPQPEPDRPSHSSGVSTEEFLAAIDELPPKLRQTYALHAFEKMKYKAIAARLGVPEGVVASRISRAKDKLLDMLIARHPPDGDDE